MFIIFIFIENLEFTSDQCRVHLRLLPKTEKKFGKCKCDFTAHIEDGKYYTHKHVNASHCKQVNFTYFIYKETN